MLQFKLQHILALLFGIQFLILVGCQSSYAKIEEQTDLSPNIDSNENQELAPTLDTTLDRTEILKHIQLKKVNKVPLVVHIFIPLCDNINQGIVPTSPSLGDGLNLRSNLYWATRSGTKRFFTNHPQWSLIYDQFDIDTNVLERVIFERDYLESKVYLVADAYRGDRMSSTINDFLSALSGEKLETVAINSNQSVKTSGYADLVIFNGHNGMMDNLTLTPHKSKNRSVDAVINACVSYRYFDQELINTGAYPLARTTSLLHPGAYVLTQIIDDWVKGIDEKSLCLNAGQAYCKKHDCGKGTKIYKSGW